MKRKQFAIPGTLLAAAATLAIFAAVVSVFAIGQRPTHVKAATNCTVDAGDVARDSEETAFLALINAFRANPGGYGYPSYPAAAPLSFSSGLDRPAAWHVNDMFAKRYFSHTEPGGREFWQRMTDCDYRWTAAGENIASGNTSDTAVKAFNQWINSPGHRDNMMSQNFTEIGIARDYGACPNVPPYNGNGNCWIWNTTLGKPVGGSGSTATPTRTATPRTPTATPTRTNTPVSPTSTATTPSGTAPVVSSLGPSSVVMNVSGQEVEVRGSGFNPNSVVRINGNERSTEYVSSTRVLVTVSPADVQANGTRSLTVANGSAVSNTATLTVRYSTSDYDCNGAVTNSDVSEATRWMSGMGKAPCGTFNPDGQPGITMTDIRRMRMVIAGLTPA